MCSASGLMLKKKVFDHPLTITTRRCFDVDSTSFERYGRQMDVETTLCAYWEAYTLLTVCNRSVKTFSIYLFYTSQSYAQDVVLTSFQRHLNVMDVRWTLKQRCVLTGKLILYLPYVTALSNLFLFIFLH